MGILGGSLEGCRGSQRDFKEFQRISKNFRALQDDPMGFRDGMVPRDLKAL